MPTGTEAYYAQRAREYDQVYAKPERQVDIAALGNLITGTLRGRRVLDIAAGSGFWTGKYADLARSVTVCDVNEAMLNVARSRRRWPDHVQFTRCDAFALEDVVGTFDAAFVGFFWSHIQLNALDSFLDGVGRRLSRGALIVIVDNRYVEGSNHSITRSDVDGNTFQRRRLADGSEWEVLKNFPSVGEVEGRVARLNGTVSVVELDYYWYAVCDIPPAARRRPAVPRRADDVRGANEAIMGR